MTIKIVRKHELIKVERLTTLIYGVPGIGKTSFANTSKKPLLLDFDDGAYRSQNRQDVIQIKSWNDIKDLTADDLKDYETIVIDTIGRLLEMLVIEIGKENPKSVKATGELQIQGYGTLITKFKAWYNLIKSFNKHIIFIGHAKAEKSTRKGEDIEKYVLNCMGSSKEEIFNSCSLVGFMEKTNGNITIDFNPTENYYGKSCGSLLPIQKVPHFDQDRTFFSDLTDKVLNDLNTLNDQQLQLQQELLSLEKNIQNIKNLDEVNNFYNDNKQTMGMYPSIKNLFIIKTGELNCRYDKDTNCFVENVKQNDEVTI